MVGSRRCQGATPTLHGGYPPRAVYQSVTKTGLGASFRFHLVSSIRVTLGLATFQLVLLLVLLAFQPPAARELLLKGLAAGIATPEALSVSRLGFASWAVLAAAAAARRLAPAHRGWHLHLPVDLRTRWAAGMLSVASTLPHLAGLWILLWIGASLLGEPASPRALVALPLVALAAAGTWTPAPRRVRACAAVAIPLAASASFPGLAAAVALLALAYFQAGRESTRSTRVPSVPFSLRVFGRRLPTGQLVFSLRALGLWITLAHLPAVLFAAPTGLAIHNNEFTPDQTDLVLPLGTSLGVTATVLGVATLLSARRPPWAWSRSLPWSARRRVAVDAFLLLLIASPLLIPVLYLRASSGLSVLALLAFLAVRLPGRMRNSLRGLTRLGAWTYIEALLAALFTSLLPLTALVLVLASPFVLETSARRERALKVGLYLERRFDAAREAPS